MSAPRHTENDFHQRLVVYAAHAALSEPGARLYAAGFAIQHTGGGCLAWERREADDSYWLVTDESGGLPAEDEPVMLGQYDTYGDMVACQTYDTLGAALTVCGGPPA